MPWRKKTQAFQGDAIAGDTTYRMQALNAVGRRYQVIATLEPLWNGQVRPCHGSRSEADGAEQLSLGQRKVKVFQSSHRRRGSFAGKLPSEFFKPFRGGRENFYPKTLDHLRTEIGYG